MHPLRLSKHLVLLLILPFVATGSLCAKEQQKKPNGLTSYSFNINEFHTKLSKKLHDLERVRAILTAYKELTSKVQLTKETWANLEKWLHHRCHFIGSKYYDNDLIFKEVPELANNDQFQQAYKKFISDIAFGYAPEVKDTSIKSPKNITILFTGYFGGGHKAPAVAIAKHLQKNGHKVQLVDVDELENIYSPKVDGYSKAQIYSEIYQKQGNIEKARELWRRMDELQTNESRRFMGDVRKMITSFKADHIIAVAHHKPNLSYISYLLGIPMTYVHTDHIFNDHLLQILQEQAKLKKPLIHFTSLSDDLAFLRPIYDALKIKTGPLAPSILNQFVRLDFPVRQSFCSVTKRERNRIRDDLGISRHAIVCKVAMGQSGFTQEITHLLNSILKEENQLDRPLHLFVICGKNQLLQRQLEKQVKSTLKKKGKIRVDVLGFMDEKEMAKIDKATNVWLTKPGGSTSAELLETQKQMIYVLNSNHPWEKHNAEYLKRHRLASELIPSKSIISQIRRRVWVDHTLDHAKILKSDWQKQALRIVSGKPEPSKFK